MIRKRPLKKSQAILLGLLLLSFVLFSCDDAPVDVPTPEKTSVEVVESAFGKHLVAGKDHARAGMSLYVFTNDSSSESTCYEQCEENWPPLLVDKASELVKPKDLDGELASSSRTDDTLQVTYKGQPLYFYAGDETPGDTNGHELGDVWFLALAVASLPDPDPLPNPDPDPLPEPPAVDGLTPGPIPFPDNFMKNIKDYGAVGDGVTDDTKAIQAALDDKRVDSNGNTLFNDYYGRPKALYFPEGTYLVSNTLQWRGCCLTLQGQGSEVSTIKLLDKAAGFADASAPKPLIRTPGGNMSFRQNVWDIGINTGVKNPGAVGLDYISNNTGSVRNVKIVSGDGQGVRGLDLTRQWPGPSLFKHVQIEGFDYGIEIKHAEYGPTFENIILRKQNVAGIANENNTLVLRGLKSDNRVPAIQNTKSGGSVLLLGASLSGGDVANVAIENKGHFYARDVSVNGYQSVLEDKGEIVDSLALNEYVSGEVSSLFASSKTTSLNLTIEETPYYKEEDLSQWARVDKSGYNMSSSQWQQEVQALLDSGKSTVYFPFGVYLGNKARLTVPSSVKRIIGFSSVVNNGGVTFVVDQGSLDPLIIEQFGYGAKVEHGGQRAVVIKHGAIRYEGKAGAGNLFIEDIVFGPLTLYPNQKVWARQFNNEYGGTKILNDGAELLILGLKTERDGTVIETMNGGKTELLGTLIYPAKQVPASDVAFKSTDSEVSYIYSTSVYCKGCGYSIHIEETRKGETRQLRADEFSGRMPLYVGY